MIRARHELQGPPVRQPLRGRYELLPEHRSREPRSHCHGGAIRVGEHLSSIGSESQNWRDDLCPPSSRQTGRRRLWLKSALHRENGAEDGGEEEGIRTRDPHPGKLMDLVQLVPASCSECGSRTDPVSAWSTKFAPGRAAGRIRRLANGHGRRRRTADRSRHSADSSPPAARQSVFGGSRLV